MGGGGEVEGKVRGTPRTLKSSSSLKKKEEQVKDNKMAELAHLLKERYFSAHR